MAEKDAFLARWSKRKAEVGKAEAAPKHTPAPMPAGADETAKLVAALPSVETLGAASDISMFLARGVPEALRNAALRKVWVADPLVRDFVSEALDYAYDWSKPGGAPGYGPLTAADRLVATLSRLSEPEAAVAEQAEAAKALANTAAGSAAPAPPQAAPRQEKAVAGVSAPQARDTPEPEAGPAPGRRGHGGALPV